MNKIFILPDFHDEEKQVLGRYLNIFMLSTIVLFTILNLYRLFTGSKMIDSTGLILLGLPVLMIGMRVLLQYGQVRLASFILTSAAWLGMAYQAYNSDGIRDATVSAFTVIIILASLLLGWRYSLPFFILSLGDMWFMASVQQSGARTFTLDTPINLAIYLTVVLGLVVLTTYLLVNNLQRSIRKANVAANELEKSNQELQALRKDLEQRVAERTKAMATSQEVSRRLSTILDRKQLVVEVVEQVKKAFNYYHAHIYFMDEANGDLILAGGTGEAGTTMLERGHKVRKGRGLVGRAAEINAPVIVPDTSQDPDWLPNPLLPETKSEIAVPIAAGEKVLGVLDVQNDIAESLGQQDVDLLRSVADQVAIAVQNAALYARAEEAIQEAKSLVDYAPEAIVVVDMESGLFTEPNENAEKLYGLTREELSKVGPADMSPTRQPDGRNSTDKALEMISEAMQGKIPVFEWIHRNGQGKEIPCEIRLVRLPGTHPRVRASVTDITERKRFEELTIQRARQQEAINSISQKIESTTSVESALQIAVRELGHALGMKPAIVTLDTSAFGPVLNSGPVEPAAVSE
jgi:PAS domain S-box-containing protein